MMADLISRAVAIEAFADKPPEYYHTGYIVSELNSVPAVDAVPVVRCRDCRYWRQEVTPTEHWICTQHSSNGRRMHTTPDFYCKDGMVSK